MKNLLYSKNLILKNLSDEKFKIFEMVGDNQIQTSLDVKTDVRDSSINDSIFFNSSISVDVISLIFVIGTLFLAICLYLRSTKEFRCSKKKLRSCYDYWKEVKCLMRILCVKVIWEAEALIFQNSPGKLMNNVKPNICGNVFTEDLQLFADQVLICFTNSALMRLFIVLRNELINCYSVKN